MEPISVPPTMGVEWARRWRYFETVLDSITDHVWIATPRLDRILYSNSAYERIFGEPLDDLYADPWSFVGLLAPADRQRVHAAAMAERPGPFEAELRVNRRDGTVRHLRVRNFPVLDSQGNVGMIAGITEDVTEEHRLQEELDATTHRLADILESTSDAIVALDHTWRYTFANGHAGELFAREPASLLGKHIWTEYPEGENEPFADVYRRVMASGVAESFEDYFEPWERWFENRVFKTDDGIVILFHEITDRKRAEIAEREYLRMLERANVAVNTLDGNRIRFWNRGAEELYGYSAGEAVGQPMHELLHTETPEPRGDIVAWLREAGSWDGTLVHRARDGHRVVVASHWALHHDPDSGDDLVVEINNDITALVAATQETERVTTELHRSERLDALGQLAGGIAHDFNNLLAVIINDLTFALDEIPTGTPAANDVDEARGVAERAAALTRQLLVFARRDSDEPTDVDLNALVSGLTTMLERTVGSHIELQFELTAGTAVHADPSRLEQIVLNLLINARDAMPHGGTIRVTTSVIDVDGEHDDLDPGPYVCLLVSDTGPGMAPEVAARAFEPFFTTKPLGQGTGLGLATVYGIATAAGGTATIHSTPGGTTVSVWLPCASAAGSADRVTTDAGDAGTILLIEDQDDLRRTARRILEHGGYRVLEASNTGEAEQRWAAHHRTVDVVVSDVVIPGRPVAELLNDLRSSRPELPIVLVSGFAPQGLPDLNPPALFVRKPFTRVELLDAIAHEAHTDEK